MRQLPIGYTLILGALLLAAILGILQLNDGMLWYDEWWSYHSADAENIGSVINRALGEPSQPPAYYLILHVWQTLVGWSPFTARAVSLFMGLLTVAWTYRLGTDISNNRKVGGLAALLLASSALFVDYLHELRLYTMMTLFSVMSVSTYWRLIKSDSLTLFKQGLFIIAFVGAVYAHLLTLLTLAAIGLYHFIYRSHIQHWRRVLVLMIIGGLSYLPWLGITLSAVETFAQSGGRTDTVLALPDVIAHLIYAFSNGTFLLAAVILLGFRAKNSTFLLFIASLILLQALILDQIVGVVTHARYLLSLWPYLLILSAMGLQTFKFAQSNTLIIGFVILWLGAGLFNTMTPTFTDTLFRDVHTNFFRPRLPLDTFGDLVKQESVTGDIAALHAPISPWAVSGGFSVAIHGAAARYAVIDELAGAEASPATYQTAMNQFLGDAGRVWLAIEQTTPPTERYNDFMILIDDYILCEQVIDTQLLTAMLYARDQILCESDAGISRSFGDAITLKDASTTVIDDTLTVYTTWVTPDAPSDTYSVGLYIFDTADEFVLQGEDFPLPLGDFAYHISQLDIHNLPPGEYTITAAVYAWQTGERLTTGTLRNDIAIASFVVE